MSLGQAWVPNQNLTLALELLLIKQRSVPHNSFLCVTFFQHFLLL